MNRRDSLDLAEKILRGEIIDPESFRAIAHLPDGEVLAMLPGADLLREHVFGKTVHLCAIGNGKAGRCSEDCRFCAQSAHYATSAEVYPLMEEEAMAEVGLRIAKTPVNRYSIVTTGRGLPEHEVTRVAKALAVIKAAGIETCASLGILGEKELRLLMDAGVSRYHHNLEAAESLFADVCTTHGFAERVQTIRTAKALGFSVCAGGIFGIGETDDQVLELALTLKDLGVDSVPVNFLVPVPGTPLSCGTGLTPLRCLKIIALLRFVLPDKEIIICGGRETNLKDLHPFVFMAGASGIMTGNYLTASGRNPEDDLETIARLGFSVRKKGA